MLWLWNQKTTFLLTGKTISHHWFYHSKSIQEAIRLVISWNFIKENFESGPIKQPIVPVVHGAFNEVNKFNALIYISSARRRWFTFSASSTFSLELFHSNEHVKHIELLCRFYTYLHANRTVIPLHNLWYKKDAMWSYILRFQQLFTKWKWKKTYTSFLNDRNREFVVFYASTQSHAEANVL